MNTQGNSTDMLRYITIFRPIVPLLLVVLGLCTIGYVVWNFLDTRMDGHAHMGKNVEDELDRLKAIGVKIGRLPGFPIQKLDFAGTRVCDDDLAVLANLPDIDQIDLSNTSITDRGLSHLSHLTQLQVLRLNDTKITDQGLTNIENNSNLWMLHLKNTGVKLTTVNLSTMQALRILDATGSPVEDAALANISHAMGLTGLGLSHTKVGDTALNLLKPLTRLEVLDLRETAVSDGGAAALRSIELPALRALLLSDCSFTVDGLKELSGLRIIHLNLSGAKIPFPEAITILGKCQSLTELVLDRTKVRDSDLKRLVQDLSQLTQFQACETGLSDAGLEELGNHPNLKLIVLYGDAITADAVNRFRDAHPHIIVRYGKSVQKNDALLP